MDHFELEKLTGDVCTLCKRTADFIKNGSIQLSEKDIEPKSTHNFVTFVDKEAEKLLVKGLSELLPEAGFITEEKTEERRGKRYDWIIDPLDGTTNFIHKIPLFSISVALKDKDELVLGVILEINLGECFYTWKGAPSFLNGKAIHVSLIQEIDGSLIATGFPSRKYERMDEYFELLKDLMFKTHGVRRIGSAAVDLAWVACGRFECFYEYYLNSWDVAAGILLVQNAGGMVTDFKGGKNYLFGREIVATNTLIHEEFMGRVRRYFK
jgi:myo-inositol-1(or 4)-monophosphatase